MKNAGIQGNPNNSQMINISKCALLLWSSASRNGLSRFICRLASLLAGSLIRRDRDSLGGYPAH